MNSSNLTALDGDVFDEFDGSPPSEESYTSILSMVYLISAELIKFGILLAAAGAAVFLLVIMLKFQRLKTHTNKFLIHYAIACSLDILFLPVITLIVELTGYGPYRHQLFCTTHQLNSSTSTLIFLFSANIALSWYVKNFQQDFFARHSKLELISVCCSYVIYLFKLSFCILDCFLAPGGICGSFLITVYVLVIVLLIVINVLTSRLKLTDSQQNTKYQLLVANYVIFSYFPLFIFTCLYHFFYWLPMFIHYAVFLTEFVAYSSPIVVVYLLGAKCKYFKCVYKKIFKRSTRTYNEEDLDELSDIEQEHTDTPKTQETPQFLVS